MENETKVTVEIVDFEVDNSYDSTSFLKLKLKLAHDGKTRKGFNFSKESLENAAPTIINKPILARVVFDSDNKPQFGSHDKHLEKDYQNNVRVIYDEVPIGIIPEDNEYAIEYDENAKKSYAYCYGYVWKKYSNYALDIIERDKNIKLSIEINISKFIIDAKTKEKIISEFRYDGVTLLGNDRTPGINNAGATTEFDLDSENKQSDLNEELPKFIDEFKKILAEFDNSKEGGEKELNKEKNVEPEQTEKTVVEGENQDFENKEAEQKEESVTGEFENTENKVTDSEDKGKSEIKDQPKEQEFELTANETRDKLRKALRALYYNVTRTDAWVNDYDSKYVYYAKEVYSEEKGWETTTYRRSYVLVDGEITLQDDEVETVVKVLTKDEWNKVESERNAQSIEFEDLKKFKKETLEKERKVNLDKVFDKFDEKLLGVEDYQTLKDNNVDFSIEDVENKCYAMLGRMDFDKEPSTKNDNSVGVIKVDTEETFEDDNDDNEYCGGILRKYYKK